MDTVPLTYLIVLLIIFILLSAFFSGSETSLMSLNRYRLRHLAKTGQRSAQFASRLLDRPDRLIGLILLLNNVAQALIPMLLLVIAQRLVQDEETAIVIATVATALMIFIFAESMPKTLGAIHPERLAFPAAFVYYPLVRVFQPLLTAINSVSNGLLRLMGVSARNTASHSLSAEELRTVLAEAGALVPKRHQQMLLSILDLEDVTVDDIMVPRNDVVGINLSDGWNEILDQLRHAQHTRMPVYDEELDNVVGILHMKVIARMLVNEELTRDRLIEMARQREAYFVPEGTPLNTQLLNFQRQKRRVALVVDEYGDVQGLVTLEDILEEIVGEFTTDPATLMHKDVHSAANGAYVVNAAANIRALNRSMQWTLPTDGPKTLSGLIVEHLEAIPEPGVSVKINGYAMEVLQTGDNAVKTVRVRPPPELAKPQ